MQTGVSETCTVYGERTDEKADREHLCLGNRDQALSLRLCSRKRHLVLPKVRR